MIGAALGEDGFYDGCLPAALASGLVKDYQMLHTVAPFAIGIPVAASESGAAVFEGWVEHFKDALIQPFDLRSTECSDRPVRQHAAMGADFISDIVAGSRKERLIQQSHFNHALGILEQGVGEIFQRELRREQVVAELLEFHRRLLR